MSIVETNELGQISYVISRAYCGRTDSAHSASGLAIMLQFTHKSNRLGGWRHFRPT